MFHSKTAVTKHHTCVRSMFGDSDEYFVNVFPSVGIIAILGVHMDISQMEAFVQFAVDGGEEHKKIKFKSVVCTNTDWNGLTDFPTKTSNTFAFFKECLTWYDITPHAVIGKIFGDDWDVHMEEHLGDFPTSFKYIMEEYHDGPDGGYTHINGTRHVQDDQYFGEVLARYDAIATKIASAFRGWKARRQYRFSPYTTLGRHLILREYEPLVIDV